MIPARGFFEVVLIVGQSVSQSVSQTSFLLLRRERARENPNKKLRLGSSFYEPHEEGPRESYHN